MLFLMNAYIYCFIGIVSFGTDNLWNVNVRKLIYYRMIYTILFIIMFIRFRKISGQSILNPLNQWFPTIH